MQNLCWDYFSGVQDPDLGVQSCRMFGFFGLDIVYLTTGLGLSK